MKINFEKLKKYYSHATWGVWKEENYKEIPEIDKKEINSKLKNDIIFVGYNLAKKKGKKGVILKPLQNYHCTNKDKRLYKALEKCDLLYRYMTECFEESSNAVSSLKINKKIISRNKKRLTKEVSLINKNATLIALGKVAFKYLCLWFPENNIFEITHHSDQNTKTEGDYIKKVNNEIKAIKEFMPIMNKYKKYSISLCKRVEKRKK